MSPSLLHDDVSNVEKAASHGGVNGHQTERLLERQGDQLY
jgi:hypothetical protein